MEDPRHPLERVAGGVSPELRSDVDLAIDEAFDEAAEFDAALEEGEWPYDDDPPDPL